MPFVVPEGNVCQFLVCEPTRGGTGGGTMSPRLPSWLTVDEAAERLGVPLAELYEAIHAGRLPAQRYGRSFLIRRADADAYESHAVTA